MKEIYIVTVISNSVDDELGSSTFTGTEEEVVKAVNGFFTDEAEYGHEFQTDFKTAEDMKDFDQYDALNMHYAISVSTVSVDTSYEAYIKSKMKDYKPGYPKEQAFANTFLSEINHGLNEKEFARALCHEHPTIQQMFFRLVRQCIRTRAEERAYSNDERNAGAVRMCQDLAKTIDKYPLPIK